MGSFPVVGKVARGWFWWVQSETVGADCQLRRVVVSDTQAGFKMDLVMNEHVHVREFQILDSGYRLLQVGGSFTTKISRESRIKSCGSARRPRLLQQKSNHDSYARRIFVVRVWV
jgi:hypothetical protein